MSDIDPTYAEPARRRGFSGFQVLMIVFLVILLTAGITYWFVRTYIYAREFQPVELSVKEQQALDGKLAAIGLEPTEILPNAKRAEPKASDFDDEGRLQARKPTAKPVPAARSTSANANSTPCWRAILISRGALPSTLPTIWPAHGLSYPLILTFRFSEAGRCA